MLTLILCCSKHSLMTDYHEKIICDNEQNIYVSQNNNILAMNLKQVENKETNKDTQANSNKEKETENQKSK